MHEMGIACSILDAVGKEMTRYPGCRAAKVDVRVGRFAGVDGESLRFCFDSMVKGTEWERLELGIVAGAGDELDLSSLEIDDLEEKQEAAA